MPDSASHDISWKDIRVLIVDDEPDMREIFAVWFRNLGCIVTEAADGTEALDHFDHDAFDAVITDVRMPRMDGIELVKHLHQSAKYTPIVIFISGFSDLPLEEAYDLGVEAVLAKPCARKHLIQTLRTSLLRRKNGFVELEMPAGLSFCRIVQSFPGSAAAAQVAIGRGGMSLDSDSVAGLESLVDFSLDFASGAPRHLAGSGIIRWAQNRQRGARIGIEFTRMDPAYLAEFIEFVTLFEPKSFIPKQCVTAFVSGLAR